jgi:hypothetical protein
MSLAENWECEESDVLPRDFDTVDVVHTLADFAGWCAMTRERRQSLCERAARYLSTEARP